MLSRGDRAGPAGRGARRPRPGRRVARLSPAAPRPVRRLDPRGAARRRPAARRFGRSTPRNGPSSATTGRPSEQIGAEDPEGSAVWASPDAAQAARRPSCAKPGHVVVIDPIAPTRAGWRLLDHCHQRARSMTVTLPFDPEPGPGRALRRGRADPPPLPRTGGSSRSPTGPTGSFRPPGLDVIERELFRSDVHDRPRLGSAPRA